MLPDLSNLISNDSSLSPDNPEDLLSTLQTDLNLTSLPRRSFRIHRKPERLHYYRPGSPSSVREANMHTSGVHTIPSHSLSNSIYPLSSPKLNYQSFVDPPAILPLPNSIDSCFALSSDDLSQTELNQCFMTVFPDDSNPLTLDDALARDDADEWQKAYDSKMESIMEHEPSHGLPSLLAKPWSKVNYCL